MELGLVACDPPGGAVQYRISGLPEGQAAHLRKCQHLPYLWQAICITRNGQTAWFGEFQTTEAALQALSAALSVHCFPEK
jgi:hypothetical protein